MQHYLISISFHCVVASIDCVCELTPDDAKFISELASGSKKVECGGCSMNNRCLLCAEASIDSITPIKPQPNLNAHLVDKFLWRRIESDDESDNESDIN